ncbi:MAG TPA: GtrA family protein [Candidatus Saccharimonadales bacterium]|nr:GtrA family protein [Candidatus Saccharimonadales bacterium]
MIKRTNALLIYLYKHPAIRYLFVGGTTFMIDEGLLIILHGVLQVWLPLALFGAYCVAFVYNFCLNRWWTFSATDNKSLRQHIVPYTALFIFNLIFTIVFVSLASHVINYAIAKVIATAIQVSWTYFIFKNVIFTKTSDAQTDEEKPIATSII